MLKIAAALLVGGLFLTSAGCCWPMHEGWHHRGGWGDRGPYGYAPRAPDAYSRADSRPPVPYRG
jgi:hypothetical protein